MLGGTQKTFRFLRVDELKFVAHVGRTPNHGSVMTQSWLSDRSEYGTKIRFFYLEEVRRFSGSTNCKTSDFISWTITCDVYVSNCMTSRGYHHTLIKGSEAHKMLTNEYNTLLKRVSLKNYFKNMFSLPN